MKIRSFLVTLLALVSLSMQAQMEDPVEFSSQLKTGSSAEGEIVFTGSIEPGWHVYSTNLPKGGPVSAALTVNKLDGAELVGTLQPGAGEKEQMDDIFGMKVRFFENKATLTQKVRFTKPTYSIDCSLEYGACNDQMCMPPMTTEFKQSGKSPAVDEPKEEKKDERWWK